MAKNKKNKTHYGNKILIIFLVLLMGFGVITPILNLWG